MGRWIIGCLVTLLLTPVVSIFAGVVYVPLAIHNDQEGNVYKTQVWLSNEGQERRRVETYLIGENEDGTEREEPTTGQVLVAPSGTVFVSNVVAEGAVGMLELTTPPQVSVQARLVGEVNGVANMGAAMPVISSENIVEPNQRIHLQPWIRSADRETDLIVVNLGFEGASCTVNAFRGGGGQIGTSSILNLEPLSMRQFPDVLGILGQDSLGAGRGSVVCDQPFYAFSATFDFSKGTVVTSYPAAQGSSTLIRPDQLPEPGVCPERADCFEILGDFHTAVRGNDKFRIAVPVTKNVEFRQLVVELDFTHGGWFSSNPEGIHNIFYLTRTGGYSTHTFGFVTTRGPGRDLVRNEVTVDLPRGENQKMTQGVSLSPGTTYHVHYLYDGQTGLIEVNVTEKFTGRQVVGLFGNIARRIRTQNKTWFITFSDGQAEAHVPSRDWTYSNLSVQFIPF